MKKITIKNRKGMTTKFILHGGVTRRPCQSNCRFFKEVVKGIKSPIKVLDVSFARKKSEWKRGVFWDKKKFKRAVKNKKIEIIQASDKASILRKQIIACNIVFIIGGREMKCLKSNLKKLKDFKNLIRGKVIVGSSAGAYVLSKVYYSRSRGKIERGMGILPIKTIAHYEVIKSKIQLKRLKATGEDLKIYKIPETEYRVLKIKI